MSVQETKLAISPSPHLRSPVTVPGAMRDVTIALMPIIIVSIYWFKMQALFLLIVCVAAAYVTEFIFRKALKKPPASGDGSALVTGILIALCFGPNTAWWTAVLAAFIGIGLAKELMGGLGWNRFNPALFGRVAVVILAQLIFNPINAALAPFKITLGQLDAITTATPLALLKQGAEMPGLGSMFLAFPGGALAETSALALLVGGVYLLFKKHIDWYIPVSIVITVFVLALIFGQGGLAPFYHLVSGGVLLGAFFMATDWVTSPVTPKGKVLFGVAIGALIMVFRLFLSPTEGTAFSILIMNAFVPAIDRLTRRPKFGETTTKKPVLAQITPAVEKGN